ncbi:3-methyl-2-oxobutanoate hydroxymethyltransferase [Actinotalea fermentans]|uniref:3-methyl-2-oxobutanoate hydroxymethyltransferase n=1 Tax=Actinotalea fermentans TaxID=43671 RepID=A0A511YTX5_9CELL|nr:3-methyl-2-oxobutanoate hydroxymethyltransferase [Actinotalea fermentans]KGM16926.1 3-methyl-2-oxobutanoate hydroxymethyltransferase [Actinotalea fermentans ATCC 43279 = JCM 9966 = DSM 3133]GEN78626.1 3-methyl-2-oxobutanoate hydroxymethyltransferase [Actinotalea fermentans]
MTDQHGPQATPDQQPAKPRRVRVHHLREAKERGEKITMLTAYDAPTARIFDEAGTDVLLVGDSLGDNFYGYANTLPVTVDEMVHHTRAVTGAVQRALVVADLPFGSYEDSPAHAFASAVRLMKEAGAHAVKFEGGRRVADHVRLLTSSGIPVMGHLGFTPQSENVFGGKRVQGRGNDAAERLSEDALALQEAGAFAVVLEMVPAPLAARITEILAIPTIGIGAGAACDGQVLVWADMAGLSTWTPRFSKQFGNVREEMVRAVTAYNAEVRGQVFPDDAHSFLE